MPSPCSIGSLAPLKHNPFESSTALTDCATHDTPYPGVAGAVSALTGTHAPSFVWITPNLNDDMHNGTVQQGDAWLKANLAPILASSWFTGFNSTVVVGMDEGDAGSTNQIPTVVISNNAKGKGASALNGTNYGLLRAFEESYGLPLLGAAATAADPFGAFG